MCRITSEYNLETTVPDVAKRWHPTKNGSKKPCDFTPGSHFVAAWRCPNGTESEPHDWTTAICNAVRTGCPFCSKRNQKVTKSQSVGFLFPHLTDQWHSTENGNRTIFEFSPSSHHVAVWYCPNGKLEEHKWKQRIFERINGSGCPFCGNRRVCKDNSLKKTDPYLIEEWDDFGLSPDNVTRGSNKKIWWKCKLCSERWQARINNRTQSSRGKTGCPKCFRRTSYLELFLYSQIKWIFPDTKNRYRINGMETDCYSEKAKLVVELDGYPWHHGKESRDLAKTAALRQCGLAVVRIRDVRLGKINDSDFIIDTASRKVQFAFMKNLMRYINNLISEPNEKIYEYLQLKAPPNMDYYREIKESIPQRKPLNNFSVTHHPLIKYWDYDKNGNVRPENVTYGCKRRMNWICHEHEETWSALVCNVAKGQLGCKKCRALRCQKRHGIL